MMRRRYFLKMMGLGAATALLPQWAQAASEAKPQPNVLFICTDDLNDWVGCLGGRSDINTRTKANHSIRDQRWRYIRYVNGDEELYDHETDPDEWNNLAARPECGSIKKKLARWLPRDGDKKNDSE